MVKNWWTSKTVWVNILTVLVGIVGVVQVSAGTLPPAALPYLTMAGGILNVILRFVTSQPVTQRAATKLQAKMIKAPKIK